MQHGAIQRNITHYFSKPCSTIHFFIIIREGLNSTPCHAIRLRVPDERSDLWKCRYFLERVVLRSLFLKCHIWLVATVSDISQRQRYNQATNATKRSAQFVESKKRLQERSSSHLTSWQKFCSLSPHRNGKAGLDIQISCKMDLGENGWWWQSI